jgi:hypothetical protein
MTTPYSVAATSVEVSALQARVVMAPLPATPTPTVLPSLDESRNFLLTFWKLFCSRIYAALQRHNTENSKQTIPEKELRSLIPIHVSVSDLHIPTISLPILLQENMSTDPGNI